MQSTFPYDYQIRQAILSDAPELARLRWDFSDQAGQAFEVFFQEFEIFLRQAFESDLWTIWVVEHAGQIIANMYVQLVQKVPRPGRPKVNWGYLTNVYVEPFARNQGLGSEMLHTIQEWAQSQHVEFLIVWPAEESINFYRKNGFVPNEESFECDIALLAGEVLI